MRTATILMVLVLTAATAHAGAFGNIFGDPAPAPLWQPQPYQFNPPSPLEDAYQGFKREDQRRRELYHQQEQQAEEARQLERTIRCNRFGSRQVFGDCFNW